MKRTNHKLLERAILDSLKLEETRRAYELMTEGYYKDVFSYAYHLLGDTTLASDVTQEVFVAAFKSLQGFRGKSKIRTWLFSIAYKQCATFFYQYRRRSQIEEDNSKDIRNNTQTQPMLNPELLAIKAEESKKLELALEKLNFEEKSFLMLHFGINPKGNFTLREIADITNRSRSTVNRMIREALYKLRKEME